MRGHRVDALQYCAWSRKIFEEMRAGGLDAVHATIAYHENFAGVVDNLKAWNRLLAENADLVFLGSSATDIRKARATGRTAVFFGFQNPAPVEMDLGMLEFYHKLGVRFMQLTYNLQSSCGAGWQEPEDGALTLFGHEVIAEMNRLGMVVDLSHAGERTTLDAIAHSSRPIAVTHANPREFRETNRNVSREVIEALRDTGGMLGLSLYPHHLPSGSETKLTQFSEMAVSVAEMLGEARLGIGSDLCQGQPDSVVRWMRDGSWTRRTSDAVFPAQPGWFRSNHDWDGIAEGLRAAGLSQSAVDGVMGENWLNYLEEALQPASQSEPPN